MSFQRADLRIKRRPGHVFLTNLLMYLMLLPFYLLFLYWLEADRSQFWMLPTVIFLVVIPMTVFQTRRTCIRTRKGRVWVDPFVSKSAEIMSLEIPDSPKRFYWRQIFGKPGQVVNSKGRSHFLVSRFIFSKDQIEEMNTYLREYQQAVRAARALHSGGNHV